MATQAMPSVILFDVNETLLDLSPLQQKVNEVLHSNNGFAIWFGHLLQYSLVDNSTGQYHDFATIAGAVLPMAATVLGKKVTDSQTKEVLDVIKTLKAHSDVAEGLAKLKEAGFRLATLTNSPPQTQATQLQNAEIATYFEQTLSVDAVQVYKPDKKAYAYAAKILHVELSNMLMVAAHGWDIAGALQAGMQAAFIEREGKALYPLAPKPQFSGKNLVDVADKIIAAYKSPV